MDEAEARRSKPGTSFVCSSLPSSIGSTVQHTAEPERGWVSECSFNNRCQVPRMNSATS